MIIELIRCAHGMYSICLDCLSLLARPNDKFRKILDTTGYYRAVATFEATEAAASVVFRTVASVKAILRRPFLVHVHYMLSPVRLSSVCRL